MSRMEVRIRLKLSPGLATLDAEKRRQLVEGTVREAMRQYDIEVEATEHEPGEGEDG